MRTTLLFTSIFVSAVSGPSAVSQITKGAPAAPPTSGDVGLEAVGSSLMDQAYEALNAGQVGKAEKLFQRVIDESPDSVGAYLGLAQTMHAAGRNADAESWLRKTIKRFPAESTPLISLARLLVSKRAFPEAEALLRAALEKDRIHPTLLDLGTLLATDESRLDEALDILIEASELKPDDAGTHFALGTTFAKMGVNEQALAEFETATKLAPHRIEAWRELARTQLNLKRTQAAAATYTEAMRANPGSTLLAIEAAELQDALGNKAEAETQFERVTRLFPQDAQPWFRYGVFLHRNGRFEEADTVYGEALKWAPDAIAILNNRAALAVESPEIDRAEAFAMIEKALKLAPQNPELLDTQAQLLEADGRYAQALVAYEKARKTLPDSPLLQYRIARVQHALGRSKKAKESLTQLLKDYANFPQRAQAEALLKELQP